MRISAITIRGFRCFGPEEVSIDLDDLTAFVGPNASGKTAAMLALARLFGETQQLRTVVPTDFHLGPTEKLSDITERTLTIQVRLDFPELEEDSQEPTAAIPEVFNQMIVDEPGAVPYAIIRLDTTWLDDGSIGGDTSQSINWILTPTVNTAPVEKQHMAPLQVGVRRRIRVDYVPAARNPEHQIRDTASTAFGRLVRSLSLGEDGSQLQSALDDVQEKVANMLGVATISTSLQTRWSDFYDGRIAQQLALRTAEAETADLLRTLKPAFKPGEDGRQVGASDLSDGLRSLFALSLTLGLHDVEEVLRTEAEEAGFLAEILDGLPSLTVFAIEEPENHLSPHYLGTVVAELEKVSGGPRAQVVLSSHSPAIVGRIAPGRVRYFLGHEHTTQSSVKTIPLPDDGSPTSKYVQGAIRSHPELYFSRLVVLGEGPSEEIILRRLFQAHEQPLDRSFISIAPLGGRHVNHFWRLLEKLEIPYITLLDLDREKQSGGWGRIQYVRDQLLEICATDDPRLLLASEPETYLGDEVFDNLRSRDESETERMKLWLDHFRDKCNVFFSVPLDIDFSMLGAFPEAYQALQPGARGPNLPDSDDERYSGAVKDRMTKVLGPGTAETEDGLGSTYEDDQLPLFPWYKYLFLDSSKPAAHFDALARLSDEELVDGAPSELQSLVATAAHVLSHPDVEYGDAENPA